MGSLRDRQKEDRRNRIVAAAKTLFKENGYAGTTIESIAEKAGVSGVTVHNYYGTKSGVLLELVIRNDAHLIDRLERELPAAPGDLTDLVIRFARIVMDHAIGNLEKDVWRQVIAAVVLEADTRLAKAYGDLDRRLAYVLVARLIAAQQAGALSAQVDPAHLGHALFHLQNARFIQFVSTDALSAQEIETRLHTDLTALRALSAP